MAPGLTPAEILARRKNYATSVIKAQNPPRTSKSDAALDSKSTAAQVKKGQLLFIFWLFT